MLRDAASRIRTRLGQQEQDACWLWPGAKGGSGNVYGQIVVDYKKMFCHRVMYEDAYGPLADGQVVMHKCDNPTCCNPRHLAAGTQSDNVRDMRDKGRGNWRSGAEASNAKLTNEQVRVVRSPFLRRGEIKRLASLWGINYSRLRTIRCGEGYKESA